MAGIEILPRGSVKQPYIDPKMERYAKRLMAKQRKLSALAKDVAKAAEAKAPYSVLPWYVRFFVFLFYWGDRRG